MTSINVHELINEILEAFQISIKHPYLQKYLKDPSVDMDQATILVYMLTEKELNKEYINECVVATILVQAALDTHDKVGVIPLTDELTNKKRQLTVLAGDYYSSLYYYILSQINDVALIQVLAKSIQEINESKMNVYKNRVKHVQASSEDIKTIDSSLLQNIAMLHDLPHWKELAKEFFYFKRLLSEQILLEKDGTTGVLTRFLSKEDGLDDQDDMMSYIEKRISFSKERILQLTKNWNEFRVYIENRLHELLREDDMEQQCVMGERLR